MPLHVSTPTLKATFIYIADPFYHTIDKHKGFGFVEFEDQDDAQHAIENMNGAELCGRVLRVNKSKAISREIHGKPGKFAAPFGALQI